jgi:SAM-dependent methyltransferase
MGMEILDRQLKAWNQKKAVRLLYGRWFEAVIREMSGVSGPVLEVGSGIGKLKELIPGLIALDLEPTCWTDMAGDAQALPVKDGGLANILAFDVLHHLPRPARFLREAERALKPGGRLVIMDPYVSPLSGIVYRYFHEEGLDMDCDPLDENRPICADAAFDSNQAAATVMFWRGADALARDFRGLEMVKRQRLALLSYPLSGGFSGRALLPATFLGALAAAEDRLGFLAPLAAFRTLVVLEK